MKEKTMKKKIHSIKKDDRQINDDWILSDASYGNCNPIQVRILILVRFQTRFCTSKKKNKGKNEK
jgi:hypothetical protein